MSLAQRLKDSLPHEFKRAIRERRHRDAIGLPNALLSLDQDIRTVFDVGANVGNMSLLFLRWFPQATVHAFEPEKTLFGQLNSNIAEAGFSDRFRAHQIGFFDQEQQAELHLASQHGANSLLEMNAAYLEANPSLKTEATETISLVRMDDFVRDAGIEHIDLVKIDVEGVESAVLRGGANTFRDMVDVVTLEVSFVRHERQEGQFIQLFQLMHDLGFAPDYLFDVEEAGPEHKWRLAQVDCMFKKYR